MSFEQDRQRRCSWSLSYGVVLWEGVGANLVTGRGIRKLRRRDCGTNKAGIVQSLMSLDERWDLFLEQDSTSMMLCVCSDCRWVLWNY